MTSVDGVRFGTHSYDANGNLLATTGNPVRTLTWTSFNLPRTIVQNGNSSAWDYGPGREKIHQVNVAVSNLSAAETTTYVGGLFEKSVSGSTTTFRNYIQVMGQVIGQIVQSGTTTSVQYFHRDHRDSVEVVTHSTGDVQERLSYDAFGLRRQLNWLVDPTDSGLRLNHQTDLGYTGQEHIDNVSLIHMGGRVYDPILGRFTSPDPFVQFPENGQGFNRYSYVQNNPLSNTDPSGFFLKRIKREARRWERDFRNEMRRPNSMLGPVIQIAAVAGSAWACGPCAIGVAGATSYSVARYRGASGSDAVRAGAISAWTATAFYGVGETYPVETALVPNVIGHGFVGGMSSAISGQDFGSGFLSGALSAAAAPSVGDLGLAGGTVASAIIGGTASQLGGGKFGNGAVTGAFGYLLNYCMHNGCYTTAEERAFLDRGDFLGYYSKACGNGDLNACFDYGVASGEMPGPKNTLRNALSAKGFSWDETYALVDNIIPLNLARAYADYLPQSAAQARFPSYNGVAQYHWAEFAKYGLSPSTFGGTPFGKTPILPHFWCPLCQP